MCKSSKVTERYLRSPFIHFHAVVQRKIDNIPYFTTVITSDDRSFIFTFALWIIFIRRINLISSKAHRQKSRTFCSRIYWSANCSRIKTKTVVRTSSILNIERFKFCEPSLWRKKQKRKKQL